MSEPVKQLTVSVVMAVYNGQRYLRAAVDSVLEQDLEDFEFLIIDDASVDNTWAILASYAARDNRVRLLRNESNWGVARSVNRLFREARGQYILRHDADDVSKPHRLAMQAAYLDHHPETGLLATRVGVINEDGEPVPDFRFFTDETGNDALQASLLHDCHLCQGSVMFRRGLLATVGLYDDSLVPSEDYDLWLRLAEITQLASLTEVLYLYRIHPAGQSQTNSPKQKYAKAVALDRALHRRFTAPPATYSEQAAWFYLDAGVANYDAARRDVGRLSLNRAIQLSPAALRAGHHFFELLMDYTGRRDLAEALQLMEVAFADVPRTVGTLLLRSRVQSRLYMRYVFNGIGRRNLGELQRPLLLGIRYDPTWLVNRGVISLLLKLLIARVRAAPGPAPGPDSKSDLESKPARPVRRVFLTLYIWSEAGGIEQVVTSLACALKRQGIDVIVFAWRDLTEAEGGQYLGKLRQAGIGFISSKSFLGRLAWDWNYRVTTFDGLVSRINPWLSLLHWLLAWQKHCSRKIARQSVHNRLRHWLLSLWATYDLDRYIRWRMTLVSLTRPPSVINQQGNGSGAALRWGKHRNVPTVYNEQNTPDETSFSIYWSGIANDIAKADCITAISSGSAEMLARLLGVDQNAIAVIPPPIEFLAIPDPGLTKALKSDLPRGRRLLAVGRLHPMKGFDILIEAAAVLAERGQIFEVVLAGDGPQRGDLLALVQARRLAGRVVCLGQLRHDALPSVFAECGVMVCPSLNLEGLGLAAVEAMSFGLPLVVSDIAAFKDLVAHNDNGLVVPAGNVTALADALEYLLNNPGARQAMGARSQSRFDQGGFQSDSIAQRHLDVYQGALGKSLSRSRTRSGPLTRPLSPP